MKKSIFTILVITAFSNLSAYAGSIELLNKSIQEFNLAFQNADVVTLKDKLTEDYRHTNSGSKAFGKSAWLKWVGSRKARVDDGSLIYRKYDTKELDIQLYENTAVVTGRNIAEGVDNGQEFTVDIRFTHVWVYESGIWKRAAFHDAKAK